MTREKIGVYGMTPAPTRSEFQHWKYRFVETIARDSSQLEFTYLNMKRQFRISFEDLDLLGCELDAIAKTPRKVTGTQKVVNHLLPRIEAILAAGYDLDLIIAALKKRGCVVSELTLKKYLGVARTVAGRDAPKKATVSNPGSSQEGKLDSSSTSGTADSKPSSAVSQSPSPKPESGKVLSETPDDELPW